MPHTDGFSLGTPWSGSGQSPFARPVAAVTTLVQQATGRARATIAHWRGSTRDGTRHFRGRQDREVRELEEHFARATDAQELQRMERDWDQRDGGGVRGWD